jgi:predicted nucleic acid-binding protein
MVLVDSTIWIEFLKSNPSYIGDMETLLEGKNVYTIEPIFAELIYGSRSEKERKLIISYWKVIPKIPFGDGSLLESAEYANNNNFHNLGIGLIDSILINATIKNKCLIWTLDKKILNNIDKRFIYKL